MNVAMERLPESQVVLDISTDEQEFEKALERAYRKVVNQVRLPGFRPGKAPRRVVERLLGRETLIEQADRDLLDPLYQKAIEQEGVSPVGEPEVEIYQIEPLAFKVTVQVYPTVELGDYTAVRVEPRHVEVADEQVEETLARLQANQSPWAEPAEPRPAREGDRVTADITVTEEGSDEPHREPLTDSVYVLGKDNLFPELKDAFIGMSVGESKTVPVSFAEDNEGVEAAMRGKTFNYAITLKKIEEQELLPLDDDFAKKVSEGRIETLEALRADIRRDLLRAERQKARTEVGTEVVNAMAALTTFDLPAVMIEKQVDSDVENLRNHLQQDHGQTLEGHLRFQDKTMEQLREELRPEAVRRLRNSLVLREIATREGVSVGPQDIDAEIDRLLGGGGADNAQMRAIYNNSYVRNMLENEVFERKLLDRVIAIATEGRGAFEPPEEPEDAEAPATEETTVQASAADDPAAIEAATEGTPADGAGIATDATGESEPVGQPTAASGAEPAES